MNIMVFDKNKAGLNLKYNQKNYGNMGIISGLKKWVRGDLGGVKCMECGHTETGQEANEWMRFSGDDQLHVGKENYPVCPECGSGKTTRGILVGIMNNNSE